MSDLDNAFDIRTKNAAVRLRETGIAPPVGSSISADTHRG
jgi:hypothetical protein